MRWFVEVSRVGESSIAEKYCVEAKQWQAALQEARKLRGDSGALSKFSIELLDRGYRAVDPALKLRYLIDEAPADSPLSEERPNGTSSDKLRVAEPVPPTTSFVTSPASPSLSPSAGGSIAPRPGSAAPPRPGSVSPTRASAPSISPRSQQLLVPPDPVPPAPPPRGSMPPSEPEPTRAVEVPVFELVRQRAEEPRAESPITYRELAFAVQPGATRAQVEALLHDRYRATLAAIEDRPPGKFVQLAVFDHVFKRRPERPPLATFAWKDWRGDPVLAFPGFGEEPMGPMSQVPPSTLSMPPSVPSPTATNGHPSPSPSVSPRPSSPPPSLASLPLPPSLAPASAPAPSVVPDSGPVIPMAPVIIESKPPVAAAPALQPVAIPAPVPMPLFDVDVEFASSSVAAAAPVAAEPPPAVPDAIEPPLAIPIAVEPALVSEPQVVVQAAPPEPALASEPAASAPSAVSAPTFELDFEAPPPLAVDRRSSPDRASRPRLAVARRRAGEDLISELFEIMHDLHFMRDVAAGAEFVLAVLDEVLPCEGALVHVFDIDTSHFVIVRAKGPHAANILLQRMPDQDPMVRSVMRASRATHVKDVSNTPKFLGPRWPALGVQPRSALCGPVKQGGRYLGLIELVNPLGDTPFHQSELNALDYICQQFAEFLSNKPIVLTADVVLAKS